MAGELSIGFLDYSDERSSTGIHTALITAASLPGALTEIGALITAIDAITIGSITYDALQAYRTPRVSSLPTDPNAQRERLFRVHYIDDLPFFDDPINAIPNAGFGKPFHFDIPTANFGLAALFPLNTDEADLGQTQIAAFVTALEQLGRSPYGGTIVVQKIVGVGKST